ncbi:bifunctional UDP-N-acetylglucosamine pyrophosphorylase/glucosamine-1-phosphate N-acetyltransferase [Microbacterium terrae]|uniref:Bifunctional protein GlmU n=1 Tax=Microbacterium terrae TaxID=69369 RepID=A0A0M2GZB3_9MICO|nr:bifunctional UDP-N-acetylglucosamine diphosphorylase/glucosamine-1-phosphate N-acetyltransferase GlmU [Microbacterium terrae]KJL39213.1 Bifunctional protein GlmU [Microbacterium terrae]MBP1076853.1 bifunctional UDP-N-acetylglucosamine pyrophosphorylase/glucosamine-1-phosphate N-acetyltransferase [Microbacterium terrae]GLJ99448.1 bifunctional protein GlmU [Microbacterium terrae]
MTTTASSALAVVVLAAGQGTRMKSSLPKVLHPIGGRTLIGHVLTTAHALTPERVVVVVRHERDLVAAAVTDAAPEAVVVDQDEIAGTGRAVQVALDALGDFAGDVLVLSGDVPLLEADTLASLVEAHRTGDAAATVLSAGVDDATGYGRVIRDADGRVLRIVEQKDASAAEAAVTEINAGVYVFRAGELRTQLPLVGTENAQGEMYLTDVVGLLRGVGAVVAAAQAPDAAAALGVNDRVQLAEAARILNARTVRRHQLAGVTVVDPATTYIDTDVTLAPDVTILPNTHLLRATTVQSGAVIGPDTSLTDCEVGAGAVLRRVDGNLAVVGAGVSVGPFTHLRPGTVLGDDVKVGSFVETKNAQVAAGAKLPHFIYVGDAEVGEAANLGAGTITANYDDVNKHRTIIGAEAHTGAHTVLVAPVRIGDGAKTGAGAVIRKDVAAGALALSVAPQRNLEGWVEKNRPGTGAARAAAQARSAQKADDGAQEEDH